MYKVKLTSYRKELGTIMYRQTSGYNRMSSDGRYRFYIDQEIENPDFWVVQSKGIRHSETCTISPKNTILLTTEPHSILVYPKQYIKQFGIMHSCQERVRHPNLRFGPAILPWFIGYTEDTNGECSFTIDYDKLKSSPTPQKNKLISVITSNKAFTKGHLERIEFVKKLKIYYGEKLDVFGRGYNDFEDKWDVLAPYKYHIVIENSSQKYYWTEKISDCFLAESYPFYYGCTNLSEYFSNESFQAIDIHNFEQSISIIDRCIAQNQYENAQLNLKVNKDRVLEEYNMFNYIATLCDTLQADSPKKPVTIEPCHSMQNWHNFYNYTIARNIFKWQQKVKQCIHGESNPMHS